MLITNGIIYTMEEDVFDRGWVQIKDGKIIGCGPAGSAPQDDEIFDAKGGYVLPGLVESHCHLGLVEDGIGFEGDDVNEDTDPSTPQMRAIDAINPMDDYFAESLAAGVTTAITGPGSGNPIGGQSAAIKLYGKRIDDMVLKSPVCMKFALGENPKTLYHGKTETPTTRMATAAIIRETLYKARDYLNKIKTAEKDDEFSLPDYDFKLESLIPVIKGELPVHFHAHRADDIFTAIRIAKEFNLNYVIVHGTDGHLIADILASENVKVITGPSMTDRSKPELRNSTFETPKVLSENGVLCSICTDHPEIPLRYLPLCAALAVKNGMKAEDALKAVTINAAKIAGIDDRVGSIKAGKDADLVLFSGDPLDIQSNVTAVFVDGKKVI